MYYEINVSKDGKHYFATAERSIITPDKAKAVYKHFLRLFPAHAGYRVDVTKYETIGTRLDWTVEEQAEY